VHKGIGHGSRDGSLWLPEMAISVERWLDDFGIGIVTPGVGDGVRAGSTQRVHLPGASAMVVPAAPSPGSVLGTAPQPH